MRKKLALEHKKKREELKSAKETAKRLAKGDKFFHQAAILRTTRISRDIAEVRFKRLTLLLQQAKKRGNTKLQKDIEKEINVTIKDFGVIDKIHESIRNKLKLVKRTD